MLANFIRCSYRSWRSPLYPACTAVTPDLHAADPATSYDRHALPIYQTLTQVVSY